MDNEFDVLEDKQILVILKMHIESRSSDRGHNKSDEIVEISDPENSISILYSVQRQTDCKVPWDIFSLVFLIMDLL